MKKYGFLTLILCLFCLGEAAVASPGKADAAPAAQAQSSKLTVKGFVKDDKGDPMIGVTLIVKGTNFGTVSNADGSYSIDVPYGGATLMVWAVSALCFLTTMNALAYKTPTTLRAILFSGEVMPIKHLHKLQKYLPGVQYVNLYGPTEITCNCTYFPIERRYGKEEKLPLGKVFPGRSVVLLDEEDRPVKTAGLPGEICVMGESLAREYYHNPEQTAKHFVRYADDTGTTRRMYRTGDLAVLDENGEMVFAGRKDFQIKHMGHRIELEEIELQMNALEGVRQSCCSYDAKRSRLSAYYTGDAAASEVHRQLKEKLPAYMVPWKFHHVKEFRLNKNGKIDRKVLTELEEIE